MSPKSRFTMAQKAGGFRCTTKMRTKPPVAWPQTTWRTRISLKAVDEDGNTILLEVIRYFFYNGEEYVILGDVQEADSDHDHCDCGHEDCQEVTMELYVMKVVPSEEDDDTEEFVPVEDQDLLEQLIRVAEATFDEDSLDGDEE